MILYACISGHGYGHGSRVAAVLAALHARRPDWRLVLSTPLPEPFLAAAFGPVPYERRPCRWEVGVIQADALGADAPATLAALADLECSLPGQIAAEAAWLRQQGEPVLVLADVGPAAAELAAALGAPLVWMGNFGWDAIYGPMGGPFGAWAERCTALYRRGTALIRCPFAMAMPWDLPVHPVGLTAGRPRGDREALRRQLDLPSEREAVVLVGFGGLGFRLDAALFARWPEHRFLVADPLLAGQAANALALPPGLRPLDLLPLCGRLLTKPGYSSFCEALTQGVGIHLVRRDGFAEAQVLSDALERHGPHRLLSREQLLAGDWQLDLPLTPPTEGPLAAGGEGEAADVLLSYAPE
ncbi:hypothetical protein KBZ20_11435 [Vulcanococcus limneticus Candia 3F8]|uniref:hypothetical protein n=1 Tax=Vulcanococcus limneticus TaxID=2170428 RepID=UPI000B98B865|nr:hypothetical protein [Vulcanococcus limneticus]MCP9791854.1 hypothetical protein [Vulcanococcus limneticus MW73D5]MCP9894382.1 hypothetical protein [Vulcanococcus limneticus Candia 3F8]MCP9897310.1 hypothetical protein [Vulcanococcus limneticus Candia 3B3]